MASDVRFRKRVMALERNPLPQRRSPLYTLAETLRERGRLIVLRALFLLVTLIAAIPAYGSGTIFYGSRAGMEVSPISVAVRNTARAIIRTKHSRENAIAFCREYVGKVTEECIREE